MMSYEVGVEIWITAFFIVPTMLSEGQHFGECLVVSCVSCNLLGVCLVLCGLLSCIMEDPHKSHPVENSVGT